MSIKKDRYEISLWEDYIVASQGEGENLIPEHYEERKIAVIGSNTMTAQWRAVEPKLVSNVNGTNVLTFKMYYNYIDTETGKKEQNPIINLLINERKIKCLWKNKWYDLIIKSCQEDSSGKSITYTCKDLFINELSKTGFNLQLDTELKNNQGTVKELATTILDGTDWQLGDCDIIKQYIEEPVYEVLVVNNFTTENITISAGQKILLFYSVFINRANFFQFWYDDTQAFLTDKSSMLVDNGECLSVDATWSEMTYNSIPCWAVSVEDTIICYISKTAQVSEQYRAKRLVRSQSQILDPLIKKYVYEYTKKSDNTKVYGYTETQYDDVLTINNYITNSKDFGSTTGWTGTGIIFQLYPLFTTNISSDYEAKSYLKIPKSLVAYNSGIKDFRSYISEGFTVGEKYIFRVKAMTNSSDGAPSGTYCTVSNLYLTPWIGKYKLNADDNTYTQLGNNYFTVGSAIANGDWIEFTLTCNTSITYTDLLQLGLFIDNSSGETDARWIEEVQFFKYSLGTPVIQEYSGTKSFIEDDVVLSENNYYICIKDNIGQALTDTNYWKDLGETKPQIRINPGSFSAQSYANIVWKFYEAGQSVLSEEDLEYLYSGDENSSKDYISKNLTPIYNENYEKIRSITGKNSNRFNLLQSLAETFECWIKFEIEHDENTGKIIYKNGIPQKWVRFVNDIGLETGIGFVYGIDLKTISRTINSDNITSKVIVSQNNNEYGQDGFCTIGRATENYPKTDYILNFDYYIKQGLLSQGQIDKDLYSTVSTVGIGYYYWLNQYNKQYDELTDLIKQKKNELDKQEALQTTYDNLVQETGEEITKVEGDLAFLAGYTTFDEITIGTYIDSHTDNDNAVNLWITRNNLKNSLKQYSAQLDNLNISIENLDNYLNGENGLYTQQEDFLNKIEELDKKFYEKYSRFIQEGSWTSDDYYDDNLYYLDAVSVAYTSSRPQITYNISVLRLSALEEFKNKIFNLGDISFIQDTEFFGYIIIDGIKTPYKEKVLVSEITSNFDTPENDSFKVQNYKTQFEDLFQRITATTQSLQYTTGAYNKAADSFTSTGEINEETLQNSFNLNQNLAWAAKNDSVVYDTTGLTVVDTTNPAKIVRISSKGIQITEDGGEHWYLGITGSGISTRYLTSGVITTDKINVMDGNYPTFRWDKYGLSAFAYTLKDSAINNVNDSNFVRFDRFGIYGINTELSKNWMPENEDEIWNTAKFGLTWKGFFLKNKYGNGYVSISSDDDFVVYDGNQKRIKIGNIGTTNNPLYGLFIADADGAKVMETNSDGTLWLKNRLNIETNSNSSVGIGKLGASVEDGKNEVINANNKFFVYEDGSIKATDGEFTGIINATGGTIGGLEINSFVDGVKRAQIITEQGTVFLDGSPDKIILTAQLINADTTSTLSYQWSKNGINIAGQTNQTLEITGADLENGSYVYKVEITENSKTFSDTITLQKLAGESGSYYELTSNVDSIKKHYVKNTLGENELKWDIDKIVLSGNKISGTTTESLNTSDYELILSYFDPNGEDDNKNIILSNADEEVQRYFNVSTTDNFWYFKFGELINNSEELNNQDLENLQGLLLINEFVLSFQLKKNGSILYTKTVLVSYKTSADFARFAINAQSIDASINSTALTFDENGLIINNGGFIIKKDNKELLKYDEENQNLKIIGNGEFSGIIHADSGDFRGTIYADSGEFKGTIEAKDGTIGGFTINENSLFSVDGNIKLIGGDENSSGKIIAENIELGNGATIKNFIKLGDNSYLYNPNENDGIFICVKNDEDDKKYISITDKGIAQFGEITINGIKSTISGANFTITPDRSNFSNVDITGTIHSSVFETGQVQTVGGAMMFRESAQIEVKDEDNNIFTTLTKIELQVGSFVLLIGNDDLTAYGKIISADDNNNTYTVDIKNGSLFEKTVVIHLADIENELISNNLLIGVNSQNSENKNLQPNAITFSELSYINPNTYDPQYSTPKILLGDLSSLKKENVSGFGLYGENVYLTGSLTTQVNNNSYAGINTLSGMNATKFNGDKIYYEKIVEDEYQETSDTENKNGKQYYIYNTDTNTYDELDTDVKFDISKIVFWAGSISTGASDIQNSKFQVTENGSLFAKQGLFEGSIITQSKIQASELYATKIFGGTETDTAELSIYDANQGIVFKTREINNNSETETLRLNSNGLSINGGSSYFVNITTDGILFDGNELNTTLIMTKPIKNNPKSNDFYSLKLTGSEITAVSSTTDSSNISLGFLKWNTGFYSIGLNSNNNIKQDINQISLSTSLVQVNNNITFGQTMKYEKYIDNNNIECGYDLYISD